MYPKFEDFHAAQYLIGKIYDALDQYQDLSE